MNSPLVRDCAEGFAGRLAPAADRRREAVRRGYQIALGRDRRRRRARRRRRVPRRRRPSAYERAGKSDAGDLALADFCQVADEPERVHLHRLRSRGPATMIAESPSTSRDRRDRRAVPTRRAVPPARRRRASGCSRLAGLLDGEGLLDGRAAGDRQPARNPLAPRPPHFPAKAKSVIWLFMNGGPSQVDTWDYKPELDKRDGQELAGLRQEHRLLHRPGRAADEVAVQVRAARPVAGRGSRRSSRTWPSTSTRWRSSTRCYTETNNHSPALFKINTGMSRMGFPCVGSWVTYGLGTREPEPARRSS